MSLIDLLRAECDTFADEIAGTPLAGEVRTVRARLDEPIRIAIAGRVKAGKSTLLNALVGERLAATDAGECTLVPTWYRHGDSYKVTAIRRDGEDRELSFSREGGRLDIDLGPLAVDDIERIEVEWPADSLKDAILVDTPGLASLNDSSSVRTRDLLGLDHDRASEADAVLYCLRHLHKTDAEYLGAFMDHSVAGASAANAVVDTVRALSTPTHPDDCFSVAVCSDGSYGIEKGLMFSYPTRSNGRTWETIQGVSLSEFSKSKIAATEAELKEEKSLVADLLPK